MFTNTIKPSTDDPSIKTLTADITKSQKEAAWGLRWDEHEVYLGIKNVWKDNILKAFNILWLEEIKYKDLNFTQKTEKEILDHIKKEYLLLTNTENKEELKEAEFSWMPEEDISVYFTKLNKEQERLKKSASTGMTHKRSHRRWTIFSELKFLGRRKLSTGRKSIS